MENRLDRPELPHLFQPVVWNEVACAFKLGDNTPQPQLISNVNVVPFVDDRWIVLQLEDGAWELPGGTCEPGEDFVETARRELMEEAGATLRAFVPFGYWVCRSSAPHPFRPHVPHPVFHRLVGYSAVDVVRTPTNPDDGEHVAAVLQLTLEAIQTGFAAIGRSELGELYTLAAYLRPQRS